MRTHVAHAGQVRLDFDRFPRRPYCTDELETGLRIRSLSSALKKRYIQVNPPHLRVFSLFDIDRAGGGLAWEDADLPPPTWAAVNPANGHAHLSYQLSAPVLIEGEGLHRKPLTYLTAIEAIMREKLAADQGFAGLITKNPTSPAWRLLWGGEGYDLGTLSEYLPDLNKRRQKRPEQVGLGRNCMLFDWLRTTAYKDIRGWKKAATQGVYVSWLTHLYHTALNRNADFLTPLDSREVHWIARSVAKWVWHRFDIEASDARFSRRQANRGRKGGYRSGEARLTASEDKRASARLMKQAGYSVRAIAEALQVSIGSVSAWCSVKP